MTARDAAWFALPGALHQLGNALLSVQGHAHAIGQVAGDVLRERRTIVDAAQRAADAVAVVRWLRDDHSVERLPPSAVLKPLLEVLRLPLRDAALRAELVQSARETPLAVEARVCCRAAVAAVQAFAHALPPGTKGRLTFDVAAHAEGRARVRLTFAADAGSLPFPVDVAAVAARVAADPAAAGVAVRAGAKGGLELDFPATGVSAGAEA